MLSFKDKIRYYPIGHYFLEDIKWRRYPWLPWRPRRIHFTSKNVRKVVNRKVAKYHLMIMRLRNIK